MRSDLVVESEGQCFLCNQETMSSSPNTEYDTNSRSSTATNKVYSLQSFSRYLKLDIQTVFKKREHLTPDLLSKVGNWNLKAELCDQCSAIVETFSKVYQELEKIEIKLTSYLNIMYGKLLLTERTSNDLTIDLKFAEGGKQETTKELRAGAMKKCSLKLDNITPRLGIQRLTMQQVTMQQAKFNSWDQQDEQESLPDNASVPEIKDIVKVEYINIDSTPGKENANSLSCFLVDTQKSPPQTKVNTNQKFAKVSAPRIRKFSIVTDASLESNKRVEKKRKYPPSINPRAGRYHCNKCPKDFSTEEYFKHHYLSKHLDARYKCSMCEEEFTQRGQIQRHYDTAHLGAKFTCRICNKDFTRNSGLALHQQSVHQQSREHGCNICGKMFKLKRALTVHHKVVHLGVKPKRKRYRY